MPQHPKKELVFHVPKCFDDLLDLNTLLSQNSNLFTQWCVCVLRLGEGVFVYFLFTTTEQHSI